MLDGVIVFNKPQDFTSHDVIAKLRGILKMRKLGHAGTLDPMATGVLRRGDKGLRLPFGRREEVSRRD